MAEITFETFSRKLLAAGSRLTESEPRIVQAGATGLAGDVASAYRAVTGGDGRLSGTGGARRGKGVAATVSAKAKDVRRYADGVVVGLVVPTGPYGLIERDIAAYDQVPYVFGDARRARAVKRSIRAARKSGESAVAAARQTRANFDARTAHALKTPYGPRARVHQPARRGRAVFTNAVLRSGHTVNQRMLAELSAQIVAGYERGNL